MVEKYLKCPSCGAFNPEDKKYCGDCGAMISQPPPPLPLQPIQPAYTQSAQPGHAQPRQDWLGFFRKEVTVLIVVIVVALASVGLVYTQPWSKIKVIVHSPTAMIAGVIVYIDGVMRGYAVIPGGTSVAGVWSVTTGTHTVLAKSVGLEDVATAFYVWPVSTRTVNINYT